MVRSIARGDSMKISEVIIGILVLVMSSIYAVLYNIGDFGGLYVVPHPYDYVYSAYPWVVTLVLSIVCIRYALIKTKAGLVVDELHELIIGR